MLSTLLRHLQQTPSSPFCSTARHAAFADFLGVVIDFSFVTSTGCVIITPKTERCARILSELDNCAAVLQLSPSLAKKIFADLEDMRSFYKAILSPERIPVRVLFFDDHTPPIIGYSDGCSSVDKNIHGLGIVMWDVHDGTASSPDKPTGALLSIKIMVALGVSWSTVLATQSS